MFFSRYIRLKNDDRFIPFSIQSFFRVEIIFLAKMNFTFAELFKKLVPDRIHTLTAAFAR